MGALWNRKFHTSHILHGEKLVPIPHTHTAIEILVPIRHVFHTNISLFVINAHVVKLYVHAYSSH